MPSKYQVVKATYVPVGPGFKYKKAGQIVTLKAADARRLGDLVRKLDGDEPVAKRNTPKPAPAAKQQGDADAGDESSAESESDASVLETETVREVAADAGESTPADERAGDEAGQRP